MAIRYKQRCSRCRKNYVTTTFRERYPVCYECQKRELEGDIKDPEMKKLFNIPEEYYKQNAFLRNIKINFLKYGKLTEKQIQAFKEAVQKIKKDEM